MLFVIRCFLVFHYIICFSSLCLHKWGLDLERMMRNFFGKGLRVVKSTIWLDGTLCHY